MKFTNLHAHDTFSIADGLNYPKDHFDFVIENAESDSMGMAITNHGNANSFGYAFQAQKDLKKKGIPFKFIPGVEFYYHPDLEQWKKDKENKQKVNKEEEKSEEEDGIVVEIESESKGKWYDPVRRRHHLIAIAYNQIGLKNLYRLVTRSYREGQYRYPRIDNRMLEQHNEGLIISTACLAGLPTWLALRDKDKDVDIFQTFDKELKPLLDIFGKDRAFLEIQFNTIPEQKIIDDLLIQYSKRSGYKLLATADSHYARPEYWRDRELYRLLGWQTKGMKISSDDLPSSIDELKCELYPKNGEQMFAEYQKMYGDDSSNDDAVREALRRGYDIAHDLCEFISPDERMKLPKRNAVGKSSYETLEDLCINALVSKNLHKKQDYIDRLDTELRVIKGKDFADYFLTLNEAMREIKKHQLSSPGRGSGAGSLILYLLDITQLDPIKNNLLFERFLSEYRSEPPDVDLDSQDRDECIKILRGLFGENEVIPITNYNTLQLKSLIKDISKFYEIPYQDVNKVTTVMETEAKQPILDEIGGDQKLYDFNYENALKHSPTFQEFIENYPYVGEHIQILYRQIKSIGRHAGGVAITDCSQDAMPVIRVRGEDQTPWTEGLTAKHLEPSGVIKYDFLGLATLRTIQRCIELILKKELNRKPTFDEVNHYYTEHLHPDVVGDGDSEVFEGTYRAGKFPGVFQFTERNAQKFCQLAKPEKVSDLAVVTSIYRPGPLAGQADKKYVNLVENPENIHFDHPIFEEVLGETKGLLVYQEAFMLLAHKLAGFTLEESNDLRKLLVKPITSMGEEMKKKREEAGEKFIAGCIKHGLNEERARKLWTEEILGFISYGFNKSLHFEEIVTTYDKDGSIINKAIKDVELGDIVRSRDEKFKEDIFVEVLNKHDHGILDLYEIELETGEKIRCTMDHKFRVADGRMLPLHQIIRENLDIVVSSVKKN